MTNKIIIPQDVQNALDQLTLLTMRQKVDELLLENKEHIQELAARRLALAPIFFPLIAKMIGAGMFCFFASPTKYQSSENEHFGFEPVSVVVHEYESEGIYEHSGQIGISSKITRCVRRTEQSPPNPIEKALTPWSALINESTDVN